MKRAAWGLYGMVVSAVVLAAAASALLASPPSFQGLGFLPGGQPNSQACGVSADGSVVVGACVDTPWHWEPSRWTAAEGMRGLGHIHGVSNQSNAAYGTSADGSVVVGCDWNEAFRWTLDGGMQGLGFLGDWPYPQSSALAVSADGSVIVGQSTSSAGSGGAPQAVRWTVAGIQCLGSLPGGQFYPSEGSKALAVSPDGAFIAGCSSSSEFYGRAAVLWTAAGIQMLGDLPGGDYPHAWATGVSADGSVVVGTGSRGDAYTGREAFRWTEETGMQGLGTGGLSESFATGVSGDGSTVVGYTFRQYAGIVACLWDASGRLRFVDDVLRDDYGLDLGGWELRAATAISPDGRAIVGYGKNPLGQEEAWIAVIPEPTTLSLLVLGGLAMLRRRGRK